MDLLLLAVVLVVGWQVLVRLEQRERIALLAGYLRRHQVERDMAVLLQGYLPAVSQADARQREHQLAQLTDAETRLVNNLQTFSQDLGQAWGERTRLSRWPMAVPWATRLFPRASLDLRRLMAIHAQGVAQAVTNADALHPKARAFRITAELLLLQHSCHWFCRSKAVAHARLLAHHQTAYEQVLTSVGDATRRDYTACLSA